MINKANNILITGAAGYIGSHVVEKLVKTKSKIIAIDNLIRGNKKLIKPGKKLVIFKLKKEFSKTSKTLIKNKNEPMYKKVFRLDLSGFKRLILDIIFLLLQFFYCTSSSIMKLRYLMTSK